MGQAYLQEYLRETGQGQAVADQGADRLGFQRLGVQAGEYPLAGGVGQQPVQRLAGALPVGPAVAGGEQDRGGGGRRAAAGQQPEAAAQVEVALREPAGLIVRGGGEGLSGDAVWGRIVGAVAPPAHLVPGHRVMILPVAGRAGEVGQLGNSQGPVDERQLGALG